MIWIILILRSLTTLKSKFMRRIIYVVRAVMQVVVKLVGFLS